jgi:(p)ppGpp synthase/HD superfamily hydrolase
MGNVEKARIFATAAHEAIDQKHKYTNEPYIVHPRHVVGILRLVNAKENLLAAAWLHDTVEDTHVTFATILREFGKEIAELVDQVTDVSKPEDGNRAVRKALDLKHLASASPDAKTLKLADLIDNSVWITRYDPKFAKVYMKEKEALLKVLTEGNEVLWKMANKIVQKYKTEHPED